MLMTAFWFVSGSLTCRNSGRSGQRKSPVEWEVNKKEKKRKKTTRFYFCPGRQQPKVQKPLNLNGTVGPIVARSKPKPGHLDLKPNRAFLLLWVLFLGCCFFFFRYACPYLTERVELEIYQLILAQFRQLNQQIASLIYCILFELTVMLI